MNFKILKNKIDNNILIRGIRVAEIRIKKDLLVKLDKTLAIYLKQHTDL